MKLLAVIVVIAISLFVIIGTIALQPLSKEIATVVNAESVNLVANYSDFQGYKESLQLYMWAPIILVFALCGWVIYKVVKR